MTSTSSRFPATFFQFPPLVRFIHEIEPVCCEIVKIKNARFKLIVKFQEVMFGTGIAKSIAGGTAHRPKRNEMTKPFILHAGKKT